MKLYEMLPNGRQEAVDQDLYNLLTISPNPEQTAFSFFETLTGCLALTGNAYAQIQRTGSKIIALWPLHPLKTEPVRIDGKLVYKTTDGMPDGQYRLIAAEDMIAIPLFSFDGLKGLSPIQLARQNVAMARATLKFGARFFNGGAKPGGILSTASNLTEKQQQDIKASWQSAVGGENQGKTAILWGDWKYSQLGITPEDSQFLTSRQFERSEIAALFRVPAHMVGDTTRLSNSNHEQQSLSFVQDTLKPYLCRIEQEIHRKCMPASGRNANRFFVRFDVRERLGGDFATTMQGYAVGKQWGFYNTNHILEALGENPIGPAGDVYWMPVNMQNADLAIKQTEPAAQPGEAPVPVATKDERRVRPVLPISAKPVSPDERSAIGDYANVLTRVFRDGLGRLTAREKRDSEAIGSIFKPVLNTILDLAQEHHGAVSDEVSERIFRDAAKSIEKRAADWKPEQADDLTGPEFLRVVRSIVANVARESAAATALKQLEAPANE